MAEGFRDHNIRKTGILTGARLGLVTGVAVSFFCWFAAAMLKGLITDFSGAWPDWFAQAPIVDFVLSGLWIVLVVTILTLAGGIIGILRPRRYELL
jgi:hypothetical protein